MPDPELWKQWKITAANLRHARQMLPENVAATQIEDFEQYLDHNELGLAMHVLERIGRSFVCPGGFWRNMQRAADTMKLTEQSKQYQIEFDRALTRHAENDG
jgi:hypothetical protein